MLGGGDADAAGQTRLVEDPLAQCARDLARAPPQPARAADVQERLVDRQRLDQRRDVVEDPHDLLRQREVSVEVGLHSDRGRTQAQRLPDVHRGAHAEPAGLVRRARDDAAPFETADDERLALQRRVIEDFDGRVERVHVDVQNPGPRVVRVGGRDETTRPVTASHASILPRQSDIPDLD